MGVIVSMYSIVTAPHTLASHAILEGITGCVKNPLIGCRQQFKIGKDVGSKLENGLRVNPGG
jgi:hypothetical protein